MSGDDRQGISLKGS